MIVAHRGASFDAPENTLAAFRLAWEQGADGIEGDFYLTKDRQIVCIHDKTTARTAPSQQVMKVANSSLAELRTLDVGSWKNQRFAGEQIPTLKEVLDLVPKGKRIFIEIKCGPEMIPVLKEQLQTSQLEPEQITIIAFDQEVVASARKELPQFKANWLTSYRSKNSTWQPSKTDVLKTLKMLQATGLGTNGNQEVVDNDFAKALSSQGTELHVWTVNSPQDAKYFAELGALSITTDKPKLIRDALQNN